MTDSTHPSLLFKQTLAWYLATFVPPGSPEEVGPMFGDDVGIPVVPDEERDVNLEPQGTDIEVWESAPAVEIAEGADVWKISIGLALSTPSDMTEDDAVQLHDALWRFIHDEYAGDVSGGGDAPGPLSGRLNAASVAMNKEDPEAYPRLLCCGDVWGIGREPPAQDKGRRITMFTLTAIAEVMPANFSPP